ncbi:unnamed protein product, partial [Adineta ricciae]
MTCSILRLPAEITYRILDHLDESTFILSLRNVCKRLNLILDTYYRYQVVRNILVDDLFSNDENQILGALSKYRHLLNIAASSKNQQVSIQIVNPDIVSRLIQILNSEHDQIQHNALWILLNMAGGSSHHTKYLVNAGVIQILIELINSPKENIQENAIWTLSNIAGDNCQYRDYVLNGGALPPLLNILSNSTRVPTLQTAAWCLLNLCRGTSPSVDVTKVESVVPMLNHLLANSDEFVLNDICFALSYLCQLSNEILSAIIQVGVIPRL